MLGLKGLMDSQQYHGKMLVSLIGCATRIFFQPIRSTTKI